MGERKADSRWLFLLWALLLAASMAGVRSGHNSTDRSRPSSAHTLGTFVSAFTGQTTTHESGR